MTYDLHSDALFEYDVHVPTRTIFLEPDSDQFQFEYLMKGLVLMPGDDPIRVIMNAPGGDEYHGMAVYDAIATYPAHITIEAYGHCMSMGSWILQAADERVLAPNCTMMIHYGTWGYEEHVKYQRVQNAEMERLNKAMEDVYYKRIKERHPRFKRERLCKMLEDETYLTPREAVDLGLADRIL